MTWEPQEGPQHAFIESDVLEVGYGGGRRAAGR